MQDITYPIHDINLVLRACDPGEPLEPGDSRLYDFTPLRGTNVLQRLRRLLSAPPPTGAFHHQVLCGHRGSGKSTELLQLKAWADGQGFLTVRKEVDRELGNIALQFSDLYLLAAMAVEEAMQGIGVPLAPKAVRQVTEWFAEVTKEDKETFKSELSVEAGAQLEAGVPFLGKIFAKFFSALKAGSEQTETVRLRLRNFPDTLIDLTNELLNSANASLAEKGRPRGLLLILDNLDRYDPGQIDEVLMRGATLMRKLACHALFTIPIAMEYAPRGPIYAEYGHSFVLPMLPLRRALEAVEEALGIPETNADAYDLARSQVLKGLILRNLPTGDRASNLQRAIACYEAALRVCTERDFPVDWAMTQNNLGNAYGDLPTGDRAQNLQRAIAAYEAALRVRTEHDFSVQWAMTQNNLGTAYADLPTGDRAQNLQRAIAAYEAALHVYTERDFPVDWAVIQNNLGNAYQNLPTGDRAQNLQRAIAAYEAALRVYTERDFPVDWAMTQNNLGSAYSDLPTGDRAQNLQRAIASYEAALRVRTERDFPVDWATTQNNLGIVYQNLPTGDRAQNLQRAIACYEAAIRGYKSAGLREEANRVEARLATLRTGKPKRRKDKV